MSILQIRNEMKQLTPDFGFNVILLDSFAPEGEKLTLVKHTETKENALQVQLHYKELAKNGEVYADFVYIYDKDTLFHFDNKLKLEGDSLC
jgi:hypothetical protein